MGLVVSEKRTSSLLIDEQPLQVIPTLAAKLGINQAILLQQINYWIKIAEKSEDSRKYKREKWWTYNTYSDWQKQMPWLSESGIRKLVKQLRDDNLIAVVKYNKQGQDHTYWYTINYDAVETLSGESDVSESDTSKEHSGTPDVSESDTSYATESLPESQSESNAPNGAGGSPPPSEPDPEGWHFEEYLRDALQGSDVPLTRARARRYTGDANKLLKEGVTSQELYEACDRVISEWRRVQLTLDEALTDCRNGKQTRGSKPGGAREPEPRKPASKPHSVTDEEMGYEPTPENERMSDEEYERQMQELGL